jgi:hypothetical protein
MEGSGESAVTQHWERSKPLEFLDAESDDMLTEVHSVTSLDSLFDEEDIDGDVSRKTRLMCGCKAFTSDGQLQVDAQRAVLKNEHLKIYVLAEQCGYDGMFSGLLSSNLLALALQEGCNIKTLQALLDTGATPTSHILLRSEKGEPVRAVYPLLYAVEKEDKDAVRCLLQAGADPLKADDKGLIPYVEAAKDNRNTCIARMLYKSAVKLHGLEKVNQTVSAKRLTTSSRTLAVERPHAAVPAAPLTVGPTRRQLCGAVVAEECSAKILMPKLFFSKT